MKNLLLSVCLAFVGTTASHAAVIQFDLLGTGGSGLRTTNENPVASGTATGGELLGGISFDDISRILSINVGWGTTNGFTNLTGAATAGHLHGPAGFTANNTVKYPLDSVAGWNSSATAGGFNGTVLIAVADVTSLLAGQLYMNVHTSTNPGGELRANLVAVPEPSALLFGAASLGLLALRRRR